MPKPTKAQTFPLQWTCWGTWAGPRQRQITRKQQLLYSRPCGTGLRPSNVEAAAFFCSAQRHVDKRKKEVTGAWRYVLANLLRDSNPPRRRKLSNQYRFGIICNWSMAIEVSFCKTSSVVELIALITFCRKPAAFGSVSKSTSTTRTFRRLSPVNPFQPSS